MTKKEREVVTALGVAVKSLREATSVDSPPSLAQASTTSTSATAFSNNNNVTPVPTTPQNQIVKSKMTKGEREAAARDFMAKKRLGISYDDLSQDGQLRANRLMSADFSWSPTKDKEDRGETTFSDQWDLFCLFIAGHQTLSSLFCDGLIASVFFDQEAIEKYLAIRLQKAGICYMHAVAVFQHYLWCLRTKPEGDNHKMLDISWYIREKFPNDKLEKFLTKGGGGSAVEFYCGVTGAELDDMRGVSIFLPRKSTNEATFQRRMVEICDLFKDTNEPALVTEFKIESGFTATDKFVYDGEVDQQAYYDYASECKKPKDIRVLHSMVMLGLKKEEPSGKVWFLLQNFWASKYLLLISGEYLASCGAVVTFAPKSVTVDLKENFTVIDAHYMETEVGPEEEEYCPEESSH